MRPSRFGFSRVTCTPKCRITSFSSKKRKKSAKKGRKANGNVFLFMFTQGSLTILTQGRFLYCTCEDRTESSFVVITLCVSSRECIHFLIFVKTRRLYFSSPKFSRTDSSPAKVVLVDRRCKSCILSA